MSLDPALAGYAGLVCLALAMKKHRQQPASPILPSPRVAGSLGWGLLALSLVLAVRSFGAVQGSVEWIGQLCLAAAALVLLMSWRRSLAFALALPALGLALVFEAIG